MNGEKLSENCFIYILDIIKGKMTHTTLPNSVQAAMLTQ